MAVGADYQVAGSDESLLRQQRVLHAAIVTYFEIVLYLVLTRKISHAGALCRRLYVLIRREVVGNKRDLFLVENFISSEFRKLSDCHGRGYVIAKHQVEPGHNQFAAMDFLLAGMRGEDFL